jgi:DNA-binding phage protein
MAADEIADRLYGLPIEEFTSARNDAATELRNAGRRDEADEVKALRKPTAAAAAVNRLVREHGDQVEEYLAAAAALRDAQFAGKGDVAAATKLGRETLDRLVDLASAEVRQTLQAAAVDDAAAEELRRGRLERELEPRGFGTLLSHAKPAPAKPKPAKPKPDDRAARAKLQQAKDALTAARSEERQARRQWEEAQGIVARAEAAVEKAQRELESLRP